VKRGLCKFEDKAMNVQNAGGIVAIVVDGIEESLDNIVMSET